MRSGWFLLCMIAATATLAADREVLRRDFVGERPPEIVADANDWLNDYPPTTLEQLRGHVVWLQFNF